MYLYVADICFDRRDAMDNENIKHVKRDNKEVESMIKRLSIVEGQVRGVKRCLKKTGIVLISLHR